MTSKMLKSVSQKSTFFAALALCLALVGSASAQSFSSLLNVIYPPSSYPALRPYRTHAANWWKWVLTQPKEVSPLEDATGAKCAQGQSGSVWFLAGPPTESDGTVVRSCTIPNGRTIVFPVVNALYAAFPEDLAEQKTEDYIREQVEYAQEATNLSVTLDGRALSHSTVERYYEESDVFHVTLPANNIYDLPAGQVLSPSVDAGYYLALSLQPGKHTLRFQGTLDGYSVDVTYNLTVKLLP